MGVKVREKPKASGTYWVFINHNGKRKSKKIGVDEKLANEYANGLISLMDGNLLLGIFGAGAQSRQRQRIGLRAVAELILNRVEPGAS